MAETALPEPRPEDDEDVVWGLSTAKALWARGERADALVWLRRAAEAAESAGQSFRSSEIGLYVSELEDVVAANVHEGRAPMHASPEIDAPALPRIAPSEDPDGGDTIADATVAAAQLEIRRRIDDEEETLVRRHPQTSQPPAGASQLASDVQAAQHHAQVLPPPPGASAPAAPAFGSPPMDASNPRATQPYVAPAVHASPFGPPLQARSASPMPPPQSAPPMHAYAPPQMHPPPMHPQSAPPLRAAPANVPRSPPAPVVTSYVASAPHSPLPATRSSAPVPGPVPAAQPPPAMAHASAPPLQPQHATNASAPPAPKTSAAQTSGPPIEAATPAHSSAAPIQQPTQAMKTSVAPAAGSAAAAPHTTAPGLGPATSNEARAEAVTGTTPSSQLAPDSEPPMAVRPGRQPGAVSPTAAPTPAAGPQKKRRRAPILDPWSEPEAPRSTFLTRREARATEARASDPKLSELTRAPDTRAEASGPRPEPADVELREDAVVVSVRSRPLTLPEDDDEVVTSAVPLDALRRRSARVPPPPPPAARPKPAESAGEAGAEPAVPPPPPLVSAPPPPAKAATPPPPPPLLAASVPPAGSSTEASARPAAPPPGAHVGQFSAPAEPVSARAKLALDAAPIASKAPGGASPQRGPHVPIAQRTVAGLPLDHAGVLAELPHELQVKLVAHARVEQLGPDEEVSGFGVVLVVDGDAFVSATIVDAPAHRLQAGALVPSRGNLGDAGVAVRVVGGASGARVAVWDAATIDPMLRDEPAIASELRDRADRLQALAGTTLGPLGELDETYRNLAVERLTVKLARPGEVLAAKGTPMRGLAIVAAGSVEVDEEDGVRELGPGELLFPDAVLRALPAPANVRASETGALLLVGERRLAEELMVTVPPLVEILSA
jgi:hypothetical protein